MKAATRVAFLFIVVFSVLAGCITGPGPYVEPAPGKQVDAEKGVPEQPQDPVSADPAWALETMVEPPSIISAPFCIQMYVDGRLILDGPEGMMVAIDEQRRVVATEIPSAGVYFDVSTDGRIWYYNMFGGQLSVWTPGEGVVELGTVEMGHSSGSISVAPDMRDVYFTLGQTTDRSASRLYRYREGEGIKLLAEDKTWDLTAVEVTPAGKVYVVGVCKVFRLESDDTLTLLHTRPDYHPVVITSDENGVLYYAAHGNENSRGIYRYIPGSGEPERILAQRTESENPPTGLVWDGFHDRLLAVQKEAQQISEVKDGAFHGLLDTSEMLSTPIALAIGADGGIYVNGDECGVQTVSPEGKVSLFSGGLVSFQPPPSGMVFDRDGMLYYAGSAPGMDSRIYRIDPTGNAVEIARPAGSPGGIAVHPDGGLYYTDFARNGIFRLESDGSSVPVWEDIPHPVGLVITSDGSFIVAAAERVVQQRSGPLDDYPRTRIIRIQANGRREILFSDENVNISFFDVAEDGTLILPLFQRLLAVPPVGDMHDLARDFEMIRDAKIAPDGSIYITDYGTAALYRLTRK